MRQLRDRGKDGRDVSSRRVILAVALRFPLTIFLKLVDKGDFEPFQIMIGMQPEYSHANIIFLVKYLHFHTSTNQKNSSWSKNE